MAKGLTTYKAKIKKLAKLRKDHEEHAILSTKYQEALEKSAAYGKVETARALGSQKQTTINMLISEIKLLGVELYEDGVREFPGSRSKNFATMEFDDTEALDWAVKHEHPKLLNLNKTEFKKIAKVLDLDFVEIGQEIRIEIDSNLNMFLPTAKKESEV